MGNDCYKLEGWTRVANGGDEKPIGRNHFPSVYIGIDRLFRRVFDKRQFQQGHIAGVLSENSKLSALEFRRSREGVPVPPIVVHVQIVRRSGWHYAVWFFALSHLSPTVILWSVLKPAWEIYFVNSYFFLKCTAVLREIYTIFMIIKTHSLMDTYIYFIESFIIIIIRYKRQYSEDI